MNRVRGLFDRIADSYASRRYGEGADPWRAYFFGGRLEHARILLRDVRGRVLDLGSGPGILDGTLPEGAHVVPLDLSPGMLRRAAAPGVAADAVRAPFPSGSFDAVVALGLTSYLEDLDPLLEEARRLLRPGGRLLFSVTRRGAPDTLLRGLFRGTVGRLGTGSGVLQAGVRIRAWSEREARRALTRSGFGILEARRHNYTVFPFGYLLRGPSLRLANRLETAPGRLRGLGSDVLLLAERKARRQRPRRRRIRVLRAIARLNVGGPARQAILLTKDLDPGRYESTLVTGRVGESEGDMLPDARAAGLDPTMVDGLGRDLSFLADLRAFLGVLRATLRFRPDVVHTHTAKAGALGRVAAFLAGVPVRIHTFHGHVLHGYFGRTGSALARAAELLLARLATRVVAVSPEVADDLSRRHRAVPASRVDVVPLGLPLEAFERAEEHRGELRGELGYEPDAPVIAWVGRLTAVKEPGLLLETARRVLAELPETRFVVAGGGELLDAMRRDAAALGGAIRFLGWRTDLPRILADTDVALLTSRNEGTPVALIEAAAAGVPAVATRVGGVPSVVVDGETGLLAPAGDADALAEAVVRLLQDAKLRARMGGAARERALARFSANRLVQDIDRLYRICLAAGDRRQP